MNCRRCRTVLPLAMVLLLVFPPHAFARIKLTTLPPRERVEIQLDHAELTLVEEERVVPLVEGLNTVDFSWANTRIDPETLVLRVLGPGDAGANGPVRVLSVSYPPGEQALVWQLHAATAGPARLRISYVLGGIDRHFHYRAVADASERSLSLSLLMRVRNDSSERFDEAGLWPGFGDRLVKPLGVNETKEVLLEVFPEVVLEKRYTADAVEHGYLDRARDQLSVPLHYRLSNTATHGLGSHGLPRGKVRIFQRDSQGVHAFLGEDWATHTMPGDSLALFVGLARDVVVRRIVEQRERQRVAGDLYRMSVVLRYEIENFKEDPVTVVVVERPGVLRDEILGHQPRPAQWRLGEANTLGEPDPGESDAERLYFPVAVNPAVAGGPHVRRLHLLFDNEW